MAATIATTDKVLLGKFYFVYGTYTNMSGGDDANTIAATDTGLSNIIAHGFSTSTEARVFRSSTSGGAITFYSDDTDGTDDGTWWALGI